MKFLTKKVFWIMLIITITGTALRFWSLDKAEGLWNDEYLSWYIASVPLGKDFFKMVFAQCHMPFYYLYLKFFMNLFGNSDFLLRQTSVFAGILSVFAMYFTGKELKNKKLGILCAALTSFSSFLIYFSQEVRPYQVIFLFSALSLLFTIKLINSPKPKNLVPYLISNLMIIFTHTIGFVFVFFNMAFTSFSVMKENKKYKKWVILAWASILTGILACTPLLLKIFTTHSYSQWWGHFTFSKLGFLLTDYFSPILVNITSSPDNFFFDLSKNFIVFAIIPTFIALTGIIKALKTKKPKISGLFYVCLATVAVLMIASISGKLVFLTKYSIEIYPILIAITGFGLLKIEHRFLRQFLIFSFCFLNLFYIISKPNSAPKMHRAEGHKIVANLLENADLKKGDYILINYYPQSRFEKYFNFTDYKVISMDKRNFPEYITDKNYQEVLKYGKTLYKPIFKSTENKYFNDKLNLELFRNLKNNQKVTMIVLNTVTLYSPMQIDSIMKNEDTYKKTPFLFLVFSYLKNQTLKECLDNLQIQRIEQKGNWYAITFIKK